MSKSKGNVVDPVVLVNHFGADPVRYYLLHEIPFGADGMFNNEIFIKKFNSDLANDLGNLVSRTAAMSLKYFDGEIQAPVAKDEIDNELIKLALETPTKVEKCINNLRIPEALDAIWELIGRANKYIDETTPWILAKDEENKERLGTVLYNLTETLRIVSVLISSFLPETSKNINEKLNIELTSWDSIASFDGTKAGTKVQKGDNLFPRIDIEAKIAELEKLKEEQLSAGNKPKMTPIKETIAFDDFEKIDLRVAKVLSCEKVKKSNKLLKFKLDLGGEEIQILSGIAKFYKPEELVGKNVVIVANLAPRKMMGEISQGMILSAALEDDSELTVLSTLKDIISGTEIG